MDLDDPGYKLRTADSRSSIQTAGRVQYAIGFVKELGEDYLKKIPAMCWEDLRPYISITPRFDDFESYC